MARKSAYLLFLITSYHNYRSASRKVTQMTNEAEPNNPLPGTPGILDGLLQQITRLQFLKDPRPTPLEWEILNALAVLTSVVKHDYELRTGTAPFTTERTTNE